MRGVQVRGEQRQPLPPPMQAPAAEVQLPLARQRADGRGAELVQPLLAAQGSLGIHGLLHGVMVASWRAAARSARHRAA